MIPLVSIYIGGILILQGALYHCAVGKLLNWKTEFKNISEYNARIIKTINLALAILFFLIGIVTIVYAKDLSLCIGLAKGINLILVVFWLWRAIWQIVYLKGTNGKIFYPKGVFIIVVSLITSIAYLIPIIYSCS
jgi:hypothetical protein